MAETGAENQIKELSVVAFDRLMKFIEEKQNLLTETLQMNVHEINRLHGIIHNLTAEAKRYKDLFKAKENEVFHLSVQIHKLSEKKKPTEVKKVAKKTTAR